MKYIYLNLYFFIAFAWYIFILPDYIFPEGEKARVPIKNEDGMDVRIIASNLNVPWEITWGPDNKIWITEQNGVVSRIHPQTGVKDTLLQLNDVWHVRTAGLLGMVLHSDMKNKPFVFLNYTFLKDKKQFSRLVRYSWQKDTLVNARVLMEIPGNLGHNGSRLAFSQGKLFWATGDALSMIDSQDPKTPNGKILRLNIDGTVPADNPVNGSPVYAWGFRNIQGMVFSKSGLLYTSEHGDANDDEVNLIYKLKNYGWPTVQGFAETDAEVLFKTSKQTVDPLKAWTPTIGPAGIDYYSSDAIPEWKNALLLVTLKDKNLRVLHLGKDGKQILSEEVFFANRFGRIRDLCISPAGDVYISTSNHDWNKSPGFPVPGDDRIIKITRSRTRGMIKPAEQSAAAKPDYSSAANLYLQYCASCHKEDGLGVQAVFPSLQASETVLGRESVLIKKLLRGSAGQATIKDVKYDMQMPAFSFLKDKELAEILSYVRTLGTNSATPITSEQIRTAR